MEPTYLRLSLENQILTVMLRFFPIIFFLCFKGLTIFAQSPLSIELDFKVENLTLEKALYELISDAEVSITLSNNLLPKDKYVSLELKNASVKDILDNLLRDTDLSYKLVGYQIVLFKIEKPVLKRKFTISGFIENKETGERVVNAGIFDKLSQIGALSNEYGFYSITLPEGLIQLNCSYIGYSVYSEDFTLKENLNLNIYLENTYLKEIVITAKNDSILIDNPTLNNNLLFMDNVEKLPSLGGESDVIRLAHLMPGIQTGADGVGGISVRGGNVDQNLFLLDGVPVYNPHHAIGIYSIYNSSAIRSAQLIRGPFAAKYGGRVSSVFDVRTKEGNMKDSSVDLDMGLTSLKLTLEGPIKENETSYFISGRQSLFHLYSVPVTRKVRASNDIDGFISYSFYDLNLKLNHKFSEEDHIYISYYGGSDNFTDENIFSRFTEPNFTYDVADYESITWGNEIASLRWNHVYNPKLFSNTTFAFSQYSYENNHEIFVDTKLDSSVIDRRHGIFKNVSINRDFSANFDFDYSLNEKHLIEFGIGGIYHRFKLSASLIEEIEFELKTTKHTQGDTVPYILKSFEIDGYVQDQWKISDLWTANLGLRISGSGWWDKTYISFQPRINLKFQPSKRSLFEFGFGRMVQHLHLLSPSNNISGLPRDVWVNATKSIKPQNSWQSMIGFQQKFSKGFEINLSGYYKKLDNLISFLETDLLYFNSDNWEENVESGQGWAYGGELFLKKQTPKFSSWLSYTISKSDRQFGEEINGGKKFPFRLDRRHNINIVFLFKLNAKVDLSANWIYSSGSLFTSPETVTWITVPSPAGTPQEHILSVQLGESKNNRSFRDYHRLDIACNFSFKVRKVHYRIKAGVYNAYVRLNPVYADFNERYKPAEGFSLEGKQISLLPIFPSLRFHLKFL